MKAQPSADTGAQFNSTSSPPLSQDQEQALDDLHRWFRSKNNQTFYLSGPAGSGKTTLAARFISELFLVPSEVIVAGPTARSAIVAAGALSTYTQTGYVGQTLHRLLYTATTPPPTEATELLCNEMRDLAQSHNPADLARRAGLAYQLRKLTSPIWTRRTPEDLSAIELMLVDEASMVTKSMARDIDELGIKTLLLGDSAQLPPIGEPPGYTQADFELHRVHRQRNGSGVMDLCQTIRNGGELRRGEYGTDATVRVGWPEFEDLAYADVIICRLNETRREINTCLRRSFNRDTSPLGSHVPAEGDRLVVTRNNHELGLVNGCSARVSNLFRDPVSGALHSDITQFLPGGGILSAVAGATLDEELLESGMSVPGWQGADVACLDFGYSITAHRAQGGQWGNVAVIGEQLGRMGARDRLRWLYTACSRATNRLSLHIV